MQRSSEQRNKGTEHRSTSSEDELVSLANNARWHSSGSESAPHLTPQNAGGRAENVHGEERGTYPSGVSK